MLSNICLYVMGLADDCYELTTLRNFCDGWLKIIKAGCNANKHYYEVALKVVSAINETNDSKQAYPDIYDNMVKPCVELIENKQYDDTFALYRDITLKLEKILLSWL